MKVLMIYNDFDCAARTGAMLRRAAGCARAGERCDIRPWRVDVLRLAAAGDEALLEALDAELIVLAGRRAYSLPTWIEQWLENWARWSTVGDAALATIRDEADGEFSPIPHRLSRFADRHGLKVITENRNSKGSASAALVRAVTRHDLPLEYL